MLRLRDYLPHVSHLGKISLFGSRRRVQRAPLNGSSVRSTKRSVTTYHRSDLNLIGEYFGRRYFKDNCLPHGEVYVARDIPVDGLIVMEGSLRVVAVDELEHVQHELEPAARYALNIFLKCEQS